MVEDESLFDCDTGTIFEENGLVTLCSTSGPDQKKTDVTGYVEKVKVDSENFVLSVVFISFDRAKNDKIGT